MYNIYTGSGKEKMHPEIKLHDCLVKDVAYIVSNPKKKNYLPTYSQRKIWVAL